jgi:hypothetical protein
MIILIAMATSSAQIEASGIMQLKSDWGLQPYKQFYIASMCAAGDVNVW